MTKTVCGTVLAAVMVLTVSPSLYAEQHLETATFAGGCFWCRNPPLKSYLVLKK